MNWILLFLQLSLTAFHSCTESFTNRSAQLKHLSQPEELKVSVTILTYLLLELHNNLKSKFHTQKTSVQLSNLFTLDGYLAFSTSRLCLPLVVKLGMAPCTVYRTGKCKHSTIPVKFWG